MTKKSKTTVISQGGKRRKDDDSLDVEDVPRVAYTSGWEAKLKTKESLPIKTKDGKVVKTYRTIENIDISISNSDSDSEVEDEVECQNVPGEDVVNEVEEVEEDIFDTDLVDNSNDVNSIRLLIANICTSVTQHPDKSMKRKREIDDYGDTIYTIYDLLQFLKHDNIEVVEMAMYSAFLLFKDIIPGYRIRSKMDEAKQLHDQQEYRDVNFNKKQRGNKGVVNKEGKLMLKKENKVLRDSENNLLTSYQIYLKFLDATTNRTLGTFRKQLVGLPAKLQEYYNGLDVSERNNSQQERKLINEEYALGLVALKCQCELVKAVTHFNFRSILLSSIISRSAGVSPESLVKRVSHCKQVQNSGEPTENDIKRLRKDKLAAQRHNANIAISEQILNITCNALIFLLQHDLNGEVSYEITSILAKVLVEVKYKATEQLLYVLNFVKLTVHQDESKSVHKKSKQERRKRKKYDDNDIEAGLLEADATNSSQSTKLNMQKYQADALMEICLLYFRIVKQKVGMELLPIALEGLGRITPLINMDTVHDLINVLKALLENNSLLSTNASSQALVTTTSMCISPNYVSTSKSATLKIGTTTVISPEDKILIVKLSCIHCAFNTLLVSTEGAEVLQCDDSIFVKLLISLCMELPTMVSDSRSESKDSALYRFNRWDLVFQCIEMCVLKRRETQVEVISAFVKVLLLFGGSIGQSMLPFHYQYPKNSNVKSARDGGIVALTLAHHILVRYPKFRMDFLDEYNRCSGSNGIAASKLKCNVRANDDADDEVCDLAMAALKKEVVVTHNTNINNITAQNLNIITDTITMKQIVWILVLLNMHYDMNYRRIVNCLTNRDITPLPMLRL